MLRRHVAPSQPPIINGAVYSSSEYSYCGGALADMNVLIVSNDKNIASAFKTQLDKECCYWKEVSYDNELTIADLQKAENEMVGYCDGIVNVIKGISIEDPVKQVYQWFQVESPFLSVNDRQTTISTILIAETGDEVETYRSAYTHLVSSISHLINNHNIVVNAVLAMPSAEMEEIAATTAFLSSKYGEALTGETIILG